jgi:hypothetical protein
LIKLSSPVDWTEHVQPVCLPDSESQSFAGQHGLLAGWGFDMERKLMKKDPSGQGPM